MDSSKKTFLIWWGFQKRAFLGGTSHNAPASLVVGLFRASLRYGTSQYKKWLAAHFYTARTAPASLPYYP